MCFVIKIILVHLFYQNEKIMKTIIQYTTLNKLKSNRKQTYLKEVSNLSYYKDLADKGIIWNFEIITL